MKQLLSRTSVGLVVSLACATTVPTFAQVTIGPDGPVRSPGHTTAEPPKRRELTVTPAVEPTPALRYSFRYESWETYTGSAVPFYYRAFAAMAGHSSEQQNRLFELVDAPYETLVTAGADELLPTFDNVLDSLAIAVRREECDWQWRLYTANGDFKPSDALKFSLTELQSARSVAKLLAVTTRWQGGNGDHDEAIDTLRMGYQMAIDFNRAESVVSGLVGVAIASMMNHELLHLIQTPDCPNLYWSLASLPRPVIDVWPAVDAELVGSMRFFADALDDQVSERTVDQWRDALLSLETSLFHFNRNEVAPTGALVTGMAILGYPRAKRLLLEEGYTASEIEAMPVGQVIALHQVRVQRATIDDLRKWMMLPYDQAWRRRQEAEHRFRQQRHFGSGHRHAEVLPIASTLLPALHSVRTAQMRLWTETNLIQAIEALRMQAANNDNRLPSALDQVDVVPVPRNPMTNQAFPYRATPDECELRMTDPRMSEPYRKTYKVILRHAH